MFDIGFSELLLIFIIGLVVLGPKRLTPPDVFSQTLLAICHPGQWCFRGVVKSVSVLCMGHAVDLL